MFIPKKFEDYTREEINEKFKSLLSKAQENYDATINGKSGQYEFYDFEDAHQYIFEEVMELLGEGIWTEYNKHS